MSTRGSDGPVDGPGRSRKVRQISGPQVDGGTEFVLHAPPSSWLAAFRRIVYIQLRKPALDAQRDPFSDLLPADVRLRSPGGREFEFTAVVRGRGARYVSLKCAGEVAIEIDIARERVKLRVCKERAWDDRGFPGWATDWFDAASSWLLGRRCTSPAKAAALGWRTDGLELCADFTGLKLSLRDAKCFTGRARTKTIQTSGFRGPFDETIQIGQRRRNTLSLDTHNKTKQVREKHRVEPEASVYAPTWRSNGWRGGQVRRVEIHARGAALCRAPKDGGQELDLSDPSKLLEPASLGRFWCYATTSIRLVTGSQGRKRSMPVDPRWLAVQAAGGEGPRENLVKRVQPARRHAVCQRPTKPMPLDRTARAAACLVRMLGEGELPADEVKSAACQAGFSPSTLRRAKVLLRIRSRKAGRGPWMWSTPWSRTASTTKRPACLYSGPQDEEALDDPLVGTTREQFGGYVAALVGAGLTANDASNVAWMLLVVRR